MALRVPVGKSGNPDLLRELIWFAGERLVELGAGEHAEHSEKNISQLAPCNGYPGAIAGRVPARWNCTLSRGMAGIPGLPRAAPYAHMAAVARIRAFSQRVSVHSIVKAMGVSEFPTCRSAGGDPR